MALADNTASRSQPITAAFPTEKQWLQGLRGRRMRKYIPIFIGLLLVLLMMQEVLLKISKLDHQPLLV